MLNTAIVLSEDFGAYDPAISSMRLTIMAL
jgi:hypothetical protein